MIKIVYTGEMDTRPFKTVIGDTVKRLLDEREDIVYLDADLMSCSGTGACRKAHPDRAINVGIAEANMMGIAAGLAASGFKPIVHSFGPFASRRSYDQVFLAAGYGRNDITVIGTDPGVCATFNGGTHMPFEDVALYRALPGATVIDITDTAMLEDVLPKLVDRKGVKYIRVGRKLNAKVYEEGSSFTVGKAVTLREGKDLTIVAAGIMVHEALKAAKALEKQGIEAEVLDMFTIKPLDEEALLKSARKTGAVLACENHNKIGGLYAACCEALCAHCPVPAACVAVEDEFGEVGPQDYLQKRFGLTAEHVEQAAKALIARKK